MTTLTVLDSLQEYLIIGSVTFHPDFTKLIVGSHNNNGVRMWETRGGKMLSILQNKKYYAEFSPDGIHVLTASDVIRLWDSSTHQPILTLPVIASPIGFSPDGLSFFGIDRSNVIYVWERGTGRLLATLKPPHPDTSFDTERRAVFSPDGQELLATGDKGQVHLWSINDGQLLRVLSVPTEKVVYVSFSPNGKLIITGDSQGRVFFWRRDIATEDNFVGLYVASCEIGASYWISNDEVVLADKGSRPHFHRLKLEGME